MRCCDHTLYFPVNMVSLIMSVMYMYFRRVVLYFLIFFSAFDVYLNKQIIISRLWQAILVNCIGAKFESLLLRCYINEASYVLQSRDLSFPSALRKPVGKLFLPQGLGIFSETNLIKLRAFFQDPLLLESDCRLKIMEID